MNVSAYAIVLLSSLLPCVSAFVPGIRNPVFRMPPRQAKGGVPSKEKKLIGYPNPEEGGPPQIPDSGMPEAAVMREAFNQRMREEWEAQGRPKIFIKEDHNNKGWEGNEVIEGVIQGPSATTDEVKMVVQDEKEEVVKEVEVVKEEEKVVEAAGGEDVRPDGAFKVTLVLPDGAESSFFCAPDVPITEAAEEAGFELPISCCSGSCKVCAGQVIEGKVDQEDQSCLEDDQLAKGYAMLCVAFPTSDIKVRTEVEAELS